MSRRPILAGLGALMVALGAASTAHSSQSPSTETGSPINDQGSSYHYRSQVSGVRPEQAGLSVQVLEFADRLLLANRTGRTITVYGYQGEPYAELLPEGTVRLNTRSPAYYLNQSFYGNVTVPPEASPSAAPRWTVLDRTGQLEWHDHRIHWMSPTIPPEVKDQSRLTRIFDWQVPIAVGSQKGAISGTLFWTPESGSGAPTGAIVALVVVLALSIAFVVIVRRRRSRRPPPAPGDPAPGRPAPGDPDGGAPTAGPSPREAW